MLGQLLAFQMAVGSARIAAAAGPSALTLPTSLPHLCPARSADAGASLTYVSCLVCLA